LADACAACRRAQSIFTGAEAKLDWETRAQMTGQAGLIAGDPFAAERALRDGYEAFPARGERGYRATLVTVLAEEAEAFTGASDYDAQGRWRARRAKLLARAGQFRAAARLADEAVSLIPAALDASERAEVLVAKAEVARLPGALGEAQASLRRALRFYQGRQMVPLAGQAHVLRASLAAQRRTRAEQGTRPRSRLPGRTLIPTAAARAAPAGRSRPPSPQAAGSYPPGPG
jgi:hypothetical protein